MNLFFNIINKANNYWYFAKISKEYSYVLEYKPRK